MRSRYVKPIVLISGLPRSGRLTLSSVARIALLIVGLLMVAPLFNLPAQAENSVKCSAGKKGDAKCKDRGFALCCGGVCQEVGGKCCANKTVCGSETDTCCGANCFPAGTKCCGSNSMQPGNDCCDPSTGITCANDGNNAIGCCGKNSCLSKGQSCCGGKTVCDGSCCGSTCCNSGETCKNGKCCKGCEDNEDCPDGEGLACQDGCCIAVPNSIKIKRYYDTLSHIYSLSK